MKKLILLIISLLSFQLSAQSVQFTILSNSIKVKKDSLYFKYRIQNNSDTSFVFYDIRLLKIAHVAVDEKFPGLFVHIYNENNEFLPTPWTTGPFRLPNAPQTYEDSIRSIYGGKYIVLTKEKVVEYDGRVRIGEIVWEDEIVALKEGVYKFQLEFLASDYDKERFTKAKKKNSSLQNCFLFEERIRSNVCYFSYPEGFVQDLDTITESPAAQEFEQMQPQLIAELQSIKETHKIYLCILAGLFFILSSWLIYKFIKKKRT